MAICVRFFFLARPLGDWYAFRHFQFNSPCLTGTTNFTDPEGVEGIGRPPAGPRKNPSTSLGLNLEPLSHETEALAIRLQRPDLIVLSAGTDNPIECFDPERKS